MVEKIKAVMPGFASANNPVDSAARSDYNIYKTILDSFNNDLFDAIIPIFVQDSVANPIPSATAITSLITDKPIIACAMGNEKKKEWIQILEDAGIPVYSTPDRAVKALAYLIQHKRFLGVKS